MVPANGLVLDAPHLILPARRRRGRRPVARKAGRSGLLAPLQPRFRRQRRGEAAVGEAFQAERAGRRPRVPPIGQQADFGTTCGGGVEHYGLTELGAAHVDFPDDLGAGEVQGCSAPFTTCLGIVGLPPGGGLERNAGHLGLELASLRKEPARTVRPSSQASAERGLLRAGSGSPRSDSSPRENASEQSALRIRPVVRGTASRLFAGTVRHTAPAMIHIVHRGRTPQRHDSNSTRNALVGGVPVGVPVGGPPERPPTGRPVNWSGSRPACASARGSTDPRA